MITAILGGSFDPPHFGHLAIVNYLFTNYLDRNSDRVFVIPCRNHPFGKKLAPFWDRYAMCELMFWKCFNRGMVSIVNPFALRSDGDPTKVDYAIDDVRDIQRMFGSQNDEFKLVIGSDIEKDLDNWKDIDELKKMIDIIVVPRGEHCPIPDISSTFIKLWLESEDCEERSERLPKMVPQIVLDYIAENNLYERKQEDIGDC